MSKVCACIPEMPKIIDGDLYAYVDILDLPNGRLLKTLCDYGFVPGISSRGSGDVDMNNEVDPETFYLETFDIVALPAVKKARLSMCESLNHEKPLKKALTESLDSVSGEEKEIMKEALDRLEINVEENELNPDDIPEGTLDQEMLMEDKKEDEAEEVEETEEAEVEEKEEETKDEEEKEVFSIKDLKKELDDFDDKAEIEIKPIVINDVEYPVESLEFNSDEDGKVVLNIGYSQEIGDNIENAEGETPVEEVAPIEAENTEEVSDTEPDEIVESLKESIRKNEELEKEVRSLTNEKAVSDAEVKKLKEDVETYRISLKKVYGVAKTVGNLTDKVHALNEELAQKDEQLKTIEENHSKTLNESISRNNDEVKVLKESLSSKESEIEEVTKQLNTCKSKLTESAKIVNNYKAKCDKLLESYISFRADMLGVRVADIKNRLDENWTIEQVESICDKILTEGVGSPAFFDDNTKVVINKPVDPKASKDEWDWEGLYDLAGLK